MDRFGEKLRQLRIARQLTLKALAKRLGYATHGYLSEIESGKKLPTSSLVLKIGQVFGVSTDELLHDEHEVVIQREPVVPGASVAFADRPPTAKEVERLRLLLSTFQDGTGQEAGGTLPGWRDFERATALAFGGVPLEAKSVFDVLIPVRGQAYVGLSCKSKDGLDRARQNPQRNPLDARGRAYLELSNASGEVWNSLNKQGINPKNWRHGENPNRVGHILISSIEQWQQAASKAHHVDPAQRYYLVLLYSTKTGAYQLFQFSMELPAADTLTWSTAGKHAKHIKGVSDQGVVFEWYGVSGGQLKYYPRLTDALWQSSAFTLEPIPDTRPQGLLVKAALYFPEQWAEVV